MIKLSPERSNQALSRLSPSEQDELLALLEQERVAVQTEQERWAELEAARPPIESFIRPLSDIERAHYERKEMHLRKLSRDSQPPADNVEASVEWWLALDDEAGKRAEADGYPAAPPKSTPKAPATVATTPDVATRVPSGRRGKLLDDVLTRTQEEMMRSAQSDDDRLALYRRGPVDLDGGGEFTDE